MDLWNVKNLDPPPTDRSLSSMKEIDVTILKNTLSEARLFFEKQQFFHSEAAVLSRCSYRMKMKFRSAKDFKAVEKLNRALLCYLEIDITQELTKFMSFIPKYYKINVTYMPTKNLLDYLLVRLQGLGKVFCRILDTCQIGSLLTQQRIHLGHMWKVALIIFSMIARIYLLTKNMLKFTCNLYQNLLPYSNKLKNNGSNWLPSNYVFPDNLNKWLEADWLEMDDTIIEIPDDINPMSFYDLVEDSDDDVQFCDEYVVVNDDWGSTKKNCDQEIVKEEKQENDSVSLEKESVIDVIELTDLGEEIPTQDNLRTSKKRTFENIIEINDSVEDWSFIPLESTKKKIKLDRNRNLRNSATTIKVNNKRKNSEDFKKKFKLDKKGNLGNTKNKNKLNKSKKLKNSSLDKSVICLDDLPVSENKLIVNKKQKKKKIKNKTVVKNVESPKKVVKKKQNNSLTQSVTCLNNQLNDLVAKGNLLPKNLKKKIKTQIDRIKVNIENQIQSEFKMPKPKRKKKKIKQDI